VPGNAYVIADGSGLSRYNLLTPEAIIRLLRFAFRQSYKTDFVEALPVAGADGTIFRRLKGTRAAHNVRAKTGTLMNVRSLSGYVETADGETLIFAMIVNNYDETRQSAEYLQDLALEYLSHFSRKSDQ
jgi:D-alanyl-D-alanine carboxypeptidase/D-alanyl-D-alanine-endopeptidase (penicillin-binding protein 4)